MRTPLHFGSKFTNSFFLASILRDEPRRLMANRTAKDAKSIKGTNPQYLVEKIIRTRVYDSKFWKEDCFGLTCELRL